MKSESTAKRFEEFMKKLQKNKEEFYKRLDEQAHKVNPLKLNEQSLSLPEIIESLSPTKKASQDLQLEFEKLIMTQKEFWENLVETKRQALTLNNSLKLTEDGSPTRTLRSGNNTLDDKGFTSESEKATAAIQKQSRPATLKHSKTMVVNTTQKKLEKTNTDDPQTPVSPKKSQETELAMLQMRNDLQRYKNDVKKKEADIIKLTKELASLKEIIQKSNSEKDQEIVALLDELTEIKYERENVKKELEKALNKFKALKKTYDEDHAEIEDRKSTRLNSSH